MLGSVTVSDMVPLNKVCSYLVPKARDADGILIRYLVVENESFVYLHLLFLGDAGLGQHTSKNFSGLFPKEWSNRIDELRFVWPFLVELVVAAALFLIDGVRHLQL